MSETQSANQTVRRFSWWALVPVGLLLCMLGGLISMAVIASSDPSFAVEPDYYHKAVHWDDHQAQQAANARLGWKLNLDVQPASANAGNTRLEVDLADARGAPLTRAELQIEAFHNARAAQPFGGTMVETRPGVYSLTLPMRRAGVWEVRLTARHRGERFTDVVRLNLAPEGGA